MFPVLKNKPNILKTNWAPSASFSNLKMRAHYLEAVRAFFKARDVLEVETPLLCRASVTDPFIESFPVTIKQNGPHYYLQTSPEYAMKRLLAADSGAIFQICKAFRQDEWGRFHNPEFTMLEWYRPNYTHHDLMNEMDDFLCAILKTKPAERMSYQALFKSYLGVNPHKTNLKELKACAASQKIVTHEIIEDPHTLLELLMTHIIEPQIGQNRPCFVYDYPSHQAALSIVKNDNPPVAERFEVYFKGLELANGFHELLDAEEQYNRFQKNIETRKNNHQTILEIDELFLAALQNGLPACAGVALGFDRLMMIALNAHQISDVLSFDFSRV